MFIQPQEAFGDRLERARNSFNGVGVRNRAQELFESILSPGQLEDFNKTKTFKVVGGQTGHIYRLCRSTVHNIQYFHSEGTTTYCAGPLGVHLFDFLVAQKLWLESENELEFLSHANKHEWDTRFHHLD